MIFPLGLNLLLLNSRTYYVYYLFIDTYAFIVKGHLFKIRHKLIVRGEITVEEYMV
jgi:hypothetical protein